MWMKCLSAEEIREKREVTKAEKMGRDDMEEKAWNS